MVVLVSSHRFFSVAGDFSRLEKYLAETLSRKPGSDPSFVLKHELQGLLSCYPPPKTHLFPYKIVVFFLSPLFSGAFAVSFIGRVSISPLIRSNHPEWHIVGKSFCRKLPTRQIERFHSWKKNEQNRQDQNLQKAEKNKRIHESGWWFKPSVVLLFFGGFSNCLFWWGCNLLYHGDLRESNRSFCGLDGIPERFIYVPGSVLRMGRNFYHRHLPESSCDNFSPFM